MGVRVSTRPDAINSEILTQLQENSVRVIELGAQNMSDRVLALNRRGAFRSSGSFGFAYD